MTPGANSIAFTATSNSGKTENFTYGEVVTLKADNACDWKIGETVVARNTDTYIFTIKKDVTITAVDPEQQQETAAFYESLSYVGVVNGKNRFRFEAGWYVPSSFTIVSANFYRVTATSAQNYSADDVKTLGKKASLDMYSQYVTYGANLNTLATYYYCVFEVEYKDANGELHTYTSVVRSANAPTT